MTYDYCIIGGGIVGLATARAILTARPGASLILLEKEDALARHQTGNNSGVIHAGVYYAPGSLKSELCRRGARMTKDLARRHGVAFETCGKLIVATTPLEQERLAALEARAAGNGLSYERLSAAQLRERETHVTGLGALFIPDSGIISYPALCQAMANDIRQAGGLIRTGAEVRGLRRSSSTGHEIALRGHAIHASNLAVCGGLQADRLARMAGLDIRTRIVPFRGEYYRLADKWNSRFKHLIYPVPDPDLPFLGIHLTRMIDGSVTVGPNAVLARAREGYSKTAVSLRDLAEIAIFPGFWKMLHRNLGPGLAELRSSLNKRSYLKMCQKYCPDLQLKDLRHGGAGIRAQAVSAHGALLHDFEFADAPGAVFVLNAPSPAATSALPIGEMIANRLFGGTDSAAATQTEELPA